MGLLDGAQSLFARWNKKTNQETDEQQEGIISDKLPELELKMSDEQIVSLTQKWKQIWEDDPKVGELARKQKRNEDYWKGRHSILDIDEKANCDNILFEAMETFLPQATKQVPEPVVDADNTEEGNAVAGAVQKMLWYLGKKTYLRDNLRTTARYNSLYYLGVIKVGWDMIKKNVTQIVIRPQKLILDPNAFIQNGRYTGHYVGEYRSDSADDLITRFPDKKEDINRMVDGKLGTIIQYIEWWTDEYTCWTVNKLVLGKIKNPHWNYETEQMVTDERGNQTPQKMPGKNHFESPQKPYIFLSVFNLGEHPFDETSLFEQNIANQDNINALNKQILANAENTNAGLLVSGDYFDKEQASQVGKALKAGGTVWVPEGDVSRSVNRTIAPPLPNTVFNSLSDQRNELRNIFGVRGSSAQGIVSENTVRGKILIKGQDADRLSFITGYLELMAEQVYDWFVQLMYVYYTEEHTAAVIGEDKKNEYITLSNKNLDRKLIVSVKEGSMIPHDNLTKHNEAVELLLANKLDPITAFSMMDFPNPVETAKRLVEFSTNPMSLFPDLMQQQMQAQMQPGMPGQPPAPAGAPGMPDQTQMPGSGGQNQPSDMLNSVPIPQ